MSSVLLPSALRSIRRPVRRPVLRPAARRVRADVRSLSARLRVSGAQAGMSTAEYAVGLVAACAFAAVLYKILTSSTMQSLLRDLISRALHVTL